MSEVKIKLMDNPRGALEQYITTLQSESKMARKQALMSINEEIFENPANQDCDLTTVFPEVYAYVLKSFSDPAEACRDAAALLISNFISRLPLNDYYLTYILPVIVRRIGCAETIEDSEEIRLVLIELVHKILDKYKVPHLLSPFINDFTSILTKTSTDPYPKVKLEACECIILVTKVLQRDFHFQSDSYVKPVLSNFSHQHFKVRVAAVRAIGAIVMAGNAKCFEQSITPMAEKLFDENSQVRMQITQEVGNWMKAYKDRYSFWHRMIPLLLTRNKSVPPINQLLVALRFFATGNHLLAVADMGGISVSTCSRIIKRVSDAIVSLRRDFIVFPETHEEQETVKTDFYRIARFPNVIGCIDCTHVKIQSPGGDDAELFRNRKSYMSINVQTIATAQLLVTDVVARWPGSTHDSAIYNTSNIFQKFERGDFGTGYLLGDSGYPLKSHLLTPYLNPSTLGQQKYNEAHIKTRNVVERQYGVLKRRFPVLALGIRLKLETATKVIVACCVLHNLSILKKDPEPIPDESILNLEELIANGQIRTENSNETYGHRRAQVTQYFENLFGL